MCQKTPKFLIQDSSFLPNLLSLLTKSTMDVGIIAGGMIGGAVILGQGRMVVTTIAVIASNTIPKDSS